jgi:DNA-binding response OmpR family regulator
MLKAVLFDLAQLNVDVIASCNGARALLDAGLTQPDFFLLNADLPVVETEVVIATVRQISQRRIMVDASDSNASRAALLLAVGADRVVGRPYVLDQLKREMLALRSSLELESVVITAGLLTVDPLGYEVRFGESVITMPARELEVLVYLMTHPDKVITVQELQEALWPDNSLVPNSNAVAVTVMHLRARFPQDVGQAMIRTVQRRGYRFYPPEDVSR